MSCSEKLLLAGILTEALMLFALLRSNGDKRDMIASLECEIGSLKRDSLYLLKECISISGTMLENFKKINNLERTSKRRR